MTHIMGIRLESISFMDYHAGEAQIHGRATDICPVAELRNMIIFIRFTVIIFILYKFFRVARFYLIRFP